MVRPTKKKQIPNLQEVIKDTAWKQIADFGAAALSLRAIARELNITAPAIYNYFPDRDALVTALIIDAYKSFGDSQLQARETVPASDVKGRMKAIGLAYRRWAHTHPQRYQLIFGTPIPGYQAPLTEVLPFGARSLSALVGVVEQLRASGKLNIKSFPEVKEEYKAGFEVWKTYGGDVDILSLSVAMVIWARVHGIVSLEIAGNLPPFGTSGDDLYLFEMDSIAKQFIKEY
ncbi:MAG TPA: TetR/AcrR family transcriptional regulator [Anaerolineales bacterium]|nr:TetR/AcrR family transcriptional regulator [Anaerolineales bacterium]